ncbi:porimin [Ranitomeya variabilis]|uniref:porimin n=1 Tax=Ranitomeya variabilis TaxID=490064 RepID=UPI0040564784
MKLSVDSRGWMWAALLLLAAAYTAEAADNDTAPLVPVEKDNTSVATTTVPPTKGNETTSKVPEPPTSPNATSPTIPISVTNHTTAKTQAPVVTTSTTTTTTTKAPVKTTSVNATTTISPVTSSISATLQKKSGFDVGSFVGGIVLTLGLLATVYFGCRFYSSKRGVRYRTIDEHEAII